MAKKPQVYQRPSEARIAERVWELWFGHGRPGDNDVCLGVVAALLLMVTPEGQRPDDAPDGEFEARRAAEDLILQAGDEQITSLLRQTWQLFWITRPELCMRCGSMARWLNEDEPDKTTVRAAAAVAREAVRQGLWRLEWTDILGVVYTEGRSKSARGALGEYYTPHNLCHMMASMSLGKDGKDIPKGARIMEPAVGTGGMLLGMAHAMRDAGLNPADYVWFANDVSAAAVAACAVNCHVWGLGPNVVLGVADSLAEADWPGRVIKEQQAAIDERNSYYRAAQMLALLRGPQPEAEPEPEPEPEPEVEDAWEAPLQGTLWGEEETA